MPEIILDGRGSGYVVGVDENNRLMTVGSIVSLPSVTATNSANYTISGLLSDAGSLTLIGAERSGSVYPIRLDLGSYLMIAGSISSMPSLSVTTGSESYIKGGSIEVWTGSIYLRDSLPSIGSYSVQNISGTATVAGSVFTTGSINQATDPWRITGSVTEYGIGSIRISEWGLIGSILGSVAITTTVLGVSGTVVGVSGIVNQGTNPWGITGSARLLGVSGADVYALRATSGTSGGYLQIDITNNPVIVSGTSTVEGSVYVIGSINIATAVLPISGIVNQGTINWGISGTLIGILGSTINLSNAGSHPIYGSIFITGSINQSTSPWMISGLQYAVGISGLMAISGIVNQGTTPWAVSGNALGVSGTAFNTVWVGVGSVIQGVSPFVVTNDIAGQDFSGATFITTGSKLMWTPGVGSKPQLKAFSISTDVAQKLSIYFSGNVAPANRPIWSGRMPNSGTFGMNLYGTVCSGPTNQGIGVVVNAAGSVDVTIWTRGLI